MAIVSVATGTPAGMKGQQSVDNFLKRTGCVAVCLPKVYCLWQQASRRVRYILSHPININLPAAPGDSPLTQAHVSIEDVLTEIYGPVNRQKH